MSDLAIKVEDLGKRYRIGTLPSGYRTLRETLVENVVSRFGRQSSAVSRLSYESIWALRHVSFDVQQGQVLGIIGPNGAG